MVFTLFIFCYLDLEGERFKRSYTSNNVRFSPLYLTSFHNISIITSYSIVDLLVGYSCSQLGKKTGSLNRRLSLKPYSFVKAVTPVIGLPFVRVQGFVFVSVQPVGQF